MVEIANLNVKEKQAIEEFQMRIESDLSPALLKDPTLYYRFLKARDFNIDEAEKMLRKHIGWRRAMQVDTIHKDFKPKEFFLKHLSPSFLGYDKDGDVIIYIPAGKLETKDIYKAIKRNDYFNHEIWFIETQWDLLKKRNKQTGKWSYQGVVIFDFDGFTLSNATSSVSQEIALRIVHLLQDNYPENLKRLYVINAPYYYVIIYSIVKTIMSTAMQKKIRIFGHNGWKEEFQEEFNTESLPAFLGGLKTDPDGNPNCNTFVLHGGKTPPIYYLSHEDRYFEDTSNVKKVLIRPTEQEEVCIEITESNSRIEWRFLVKSKDIGFGLFLETSNQTKEELIPIVKFSTPDGTEEGYYQCKSAGKYVLIFDNTYSWMKSKEVEYSIKVIQGN